MAKLFNNVVTVFVVCILLLVIIPLSPVALDFMFILNISISMIILLLSMQIKEPLEFSVFPSLLLITTLLRVGLNVSSTRLILGHGGEAGQVIKAFGKFVIGGSPIIGFIIFLIAIVAESRRAPLDLPEAEQELVGGFHTEYSCMKFGMFFVGEYLGITLSSAMLVTLFFGGWLGPWLPPLVWFCLKTAVGIMFFILLRGALARPRYDQLMSLGWKVLLPAGLLNLLVTGTIVLTLHG